MACPRVAEPDGPTVADLDATMAFFESRPIMERPLDPGLEPVVGLVDLSAEACAACHAEIAAEWKLSVHSQAWVDPQYQKEITKSGNRWLCLNCHTPLLTQQDVWPSGLEDGDVDRPILAENPYFDADLRNEGITCAACHVREGVVYGPGLGGDAPHPVKADPGFRSGEMCHRCHQAERTYEGKNFVCTFTTAAELAAGAWAGEATCTSCHMPIVSRPAATGGPVREVRRHWWKGAGIPKIAGVYPPQEANSPGLDLRATWGDTLRIEMENARAGHMLPTGDPERWIAVDVRFLGDSGDVGTWTYRIGQRWEWEPSPKKLGDNRLAPKEVRIEEVPIPAGALSAEIDAWNHRLSDANAEYHHLEDYPRKVRTHHLQVGSVGSGMKQQQPPRR